MLKEYIRSFKKELERKKNAPVSHPGAAELLVTSPRDGILKIELLPQFLQMLSLGAQDSCNMRIVLPALEHRPAEKCHSFRKINDIVQLVVWTDVLRNEDITYRFHYTAGEVLFLLIPPDRKEIGNSEYSYVDEIDGTLVLPEGLEKIGWSAFSESNCMKRVILPASLNCISGNPFGYCNDLVTIDVMPENPVVTSVDGVLYTKDRKTLFVCPAGRKQLFVPDGVEQFGYIALLGCDLELLSLPASFILSDDNKLHQRYDPYPHIQKIEWRDIPKEAHSTKMKGWICVIQNHSFHEDF